MRCPISYAPCDRGLYAAKGLRMLSPRLKELQPFPYTSEAAVQLAGEQKSRMSLSGVQPKLRGLTREDLEEYLGREVLGLPESRVVSTRRSLEAAMVRAADFIYAKSFLSDAMKAAYLFILGERRLRLGMDVPLPQGAHTGYLFLEERQGLPYARLEVRGRNMVFSPRSGLEEHDGKLVRLVAGPGGDVTPESAI